MAMKTPVAFLIFNRPDTSAQVFAAIRQARPSKLLVVADGPRADRPGEAERCAATRAIIDGVDWPCEVLKNFAPENMGCKRRIASGLEWVFQEVEEAIILEDDCLPHPDFFPFCEKMLERYRDDERIMMVGGTNYLQDRLKIEESYCFSRYFAIWGWATWRRAWSRYDITMKEWPTMKNVGQLEVFYAQRYMRNIVARMFEAAYQNRIDTWDIQWFYACLFNSTLSIVPKVNLISNIGTEGAHAQGGSANNFFPVFTLETERLVHPSLCHPNLLYDGPFFAEQFRPKLSTYLRSLTALLKMLYRLLVGGVK